MHIIYIQMHVDGGIEWSRFSRI